MVPTNMQNFKLMALLLLEIDSTKISFPKWNESLRFDIYPLESTKAWEKITFYA